MFPNLSLRLFKLIVGALELTEGQRSFLTISYISTLELNFITQIRPFIAYSWSSAKKLENWLL